MQLGTAQASVCNLPMFAASHSFTAGDSPWFVVAGDFNGDGKADAAVANFTSNNISVFLGNGNGTLKPPVNYTVGVEPNWIAAADLNGDGKLDLVVSSNGCAPCTAGQLGGGLWLLLGKGDGTFHGAVNVYPGNEGTVTIADLNGDGKLDLVIGSIDSGFTLLLGNGNGTFQAATEIPSGTIAGYLAVVGDFNGDGKPDLLGADLPTGNIVVVPGKGNGTFGNPIVSGNQTLNDGFLFAAAGDFNGDHKLDVVTVDGNSNDVQVWLGNGDGTFQAPTNYTVGTRPTNLVIGDFNRDGIQDLAVLGGPLPSTISILLGKGNGTFQAAVNYIPTGNAIKSAALADFNGDGKADLIVTSQVVEQPTGVYVVLGNGNGTFQTAPTYQAGKNPQTAAIGDLNGDGIPDFATANNGSNDVSVLLGKGDGTFKPAVNYPAGGGATSIAIADFNGDGKPDLAVANVAVGTVSILLGNGNGTFKTKTDVSILFGALGLAAGDFNKDGKQDLAVVSLIGISVLIGKGDGTFQSPVTNGSRGGFGNVLVADLNGDGRPDLAVSNTGSNTISVLLGNGDGTFKGNVDYTADTNQSVQTLAVGDLNGDGKLDIVVADFGCGDCGHTGVIGNIAVLMGNGDGTFKKAVAYPAGDPIQSVALGDFNGDGKLDVAVSNFLTFRVSILLNNGDGTFQASTGFGADNSTSFVTVGDLNRDGRLDIVALNAGANDVSILLNNCACSGSSCTGITSVVNGASFLPGFAGAEWITIEGNNLYNGASEVLGFANGSYPTSSKGVSVTVGGKAAFLYYVSPTQLNVISPDLSSPGAVQVVVTNNGSPSEPFSTQLESFAPAFFVWPGGYAVATDQAFKFKVKAGTFKGLATSATGPGDVLILWGTGFGLANPTVAAGHQVPGDQTYHVSSSVQVTIGGESAKVFGAALAPGFASLVQVAVQVPNLEDGDYPVIASVGGKNSPSTTMLTVQK